jgi:hypothetical protein
MVRLEDVLRYGLIIGGAYLALRAVRGVQVTPMPEIRVPPPPEPPPELPPPPMPPPPVLARPPVEFLLPPPPRVVTPPALPPTPTPPPPPKLPPVTPLPTPSPPPPPPSAVVTRREPFRPASVDIDPPRATYYREHSVCVSKEIVYEWLGGFKPPALELYFINLDSNMRVLVGTLPLITDFGGSGIYAGIIDNERVVSSLNQLGAGVVEALGVQGVVSNRYSIVKLLDSYSPDMCRAEGDPKERAICCAIKVLGHVFSPCHSPALGNAERVAREGRIQDYVIPRWCYE